MVLGAALDDDLLGHAAGPHVMMVAAVALDHDPCLRVRGCARERCSECENGREQQELPKHERLHVSRPGGRQTRPQPPKTAKVPQPCLSAVQGCNCAATSPQP